MGACTLVLTVLLAGDGPVADSTALRPIMVRPNFQRDRVLVYRLEQEKEAKLRGRESAPFVSRSAYQFRLEPRTISAAEVEMHAVFERIEWSVRGTSADFSFDSASPARSNEPPHLTFVRQAVGRDFDVSLDGFDLTPKLGRVQSLYHQRPGKFEDAKIPFAAARADEVLGPAALTNLFRGMFSWYPSEAVVPGRHWERQERFPFGATSLVRKNTVGLTAIDDRRLLFHSQIEVAAIDADKSARPALPPVQFFAANPGFAKISYRKDPGIVESIEAQLSFVMKAIVKPDKQFPTGEIEQNLRAQSSLRLLEIRTTTRLGN